MQNNIYTVQFKRKRQGRTYYRKRMKMLMSDKHRFVVRKSLKGVQASVIEYNPKGDKVILTINPKSLEKIGWKGNNGNLPSAYLVGMMAGKKAIEKGVKEAILDLGFNNPTKGSRLYAVLAGAIDSGLSIPCDPSVLPSKERLSGEHIAKYGTLLKKDSNKYQKQFSDYGKKGMEPENLAKHFNEIKSKLK